MGNNNKKIGLLGGGSWATALVKLLLNNCDNVNWWVRNQENVKYISKFKHNPHYLESVQLDVSKLNVSSNLLEVLKQSDVIIVAIPAAFLNEAFKNVPKELVANKILFSAVKGIVPEYHAIPARFFHKQLGMPYESIGMICGPCHAEEVALEKLSYLTMACQNEEHGKFMANSLSCRYLKTSLSDDLFGTEISSVLKNVYAIASGICHGLGYGDNFQSVLVSNALLEIEHFIDAVNPIHRDVKSSAYLGDLLVTTYSPFSRNRTLGNMIGRGLSVKAALLEMDMVAEGYYAVASIQEINKKFKVNMPICQAVYNILYEKISPVIEIKLLSDKIT